MNDLTHFDDEGRSRMVDVSGKNITHREATASGYIIMNPKTLKRILDSDIAKGNVFEVSRVAAVMGVKQTSNLIPMCHPLNITKVDVFFQPDVENSRVRIVVTVGLDGKTGIEMEALTGVNIAALTIYDMCKAIDKEMMISEVCLEKKSGGKSGTYLRNKDQ